MKCANERLEVRQRAWATGALYAKHGLPLSVIIRGLLAPVLRPLLRGTGVDGLLYGATVIWARIKGMIGWRMRYRRNLPSAFSDKNLADYEVGMPLPPLPRK